jgi:hypothetical protein
MQKYITVSYINNTSIIPTLNVEAAVSSETLLLIYQST